MSRIGMEVDSLTGGRKRRGVASSRPSPNSRAGTVKARRRAKLSPQEGGRIIALPKRKGDRVKAGEVVLELDASDQRLPS